MIEANLKKDKTGFSVVELCIVLAVTVILAAISLPMLTSSMHSMQLVSDARSIATTMTYAKLSAASQMTWYRISFNLSGNDWRLEKRNRSTLEFELQNSANGLSGGVANSGIAFRTTSTTNPPGFLTTSSNTITFTSRGTPQEGASIIYLSNNDEDYAVSVSLSGNIQVWRYRDNQWCSI